MARTTKTTKTAAPATAEPVVDTPAVDTPVVETPVVETEAPAVPEVVVDDAANFEAAQQKIAALIASAKEIQALVKTLQKAFVKLSKSKSKGKRASGGNATPSGFVKPAPLSDALATFLGLETGSSLPRTEVTKLVNEYVKSNNLQNPTDRRTILPDAKLKALLNPGEDDNVTYFNLQRYLKPHFLKADSAVAALA